MSRGFDLISLLPFFFFWIVILLYISDFSVYFTSIV